MRNLAMAATLLFAFVGGAQASSTPGQDANDARMTEFAASRAPMGYIQFCRDYPGECQSGPVISRSLNLTRERMRQLDEVNEMVNQSIIPVTDEELYGVAEKWTYPLDRGDCEDYVLLKRHLLIKRGWPESSLLITVVRDQQGDGHAVLTVVTASGDLVLDNQESDIRFWGDTPYDFLKRQSRNDPNAWVSLRQDDTRDQKSVGVTPNR